MAQAAPKGRPGAAKPKMDSEGEPRLKRRPAAGSTNGATRPAPTLKILETRILRGPNYWAREPVVRMVVDLGVLEDFPSNKIPGFVDALVGLLPTLEDHACSLGRRGGFITRLREGTWAGHIAEHIALELQNLAGTDVRHGKTRTTGETGRYNVIFEFREEAVGIEAGKLAVALVNYLVAPSDPATALDFMVEMERLIRLAEKSRLRAVDPGDPRRGGQPRHPVHPARPALPCPARPGGPPAADPGNDDVEDVGDRRRHRERQEPDQPAPRLGRAARPKSAVVTTEEATVEAARRIGFPCVVKPLDGNHGRGVHLDLRSDEAVRARVRRRARPRSAKRAISSSRAMSRAMTIAAS